MGDDVDTVIETLRKGDMLEVEHLRDVAGTVSKLLARLGAVHKRGAYVLETATGRTTKKHSLEMIRDALPHLRKGMTTAQARANALKRGPRFVEREMSKEDAERHWFDRRIKTNALALQRMKGWNLAAAYRQLGPSGRPSPGRPREKT